MLDVTTHWWWAIVVAAVSGAFGGLVYDLALSRQGDSGLLELFSRQRPSDGTDRTFVDLGFLASMLIGVVAAVGFLYFLTPEMRSVTGADGKTSVTRVYDPFKLIAASLIVGTEGAAFLKAMQDRLLRIVPGAGLQASTGTVVASRTDVVVRKSHDAGEVVRPPDALGRLLRGDVPPLRGRG
jgi:hypothetical protein